ncbi:MAG: hypothetical protein ABSH02_17840 [Candidatus Sulfotelmatobacter sp.]|jgi:hypothetical protein
MTEQSQALSPHLAKRLLAYAAMAGAGIAASTSPATAEVVYTPTHNNIDQDYYLDLNNDGIGDFHIHSYYLSGIGNFEVHPMIPINKIAAVDKGCPRGPGAAPLPKGAVIGPGLTLDGNATCMGFMLSWYSTGPWLGLKDRYLGFEFYIDGQKHYGWARLSMQDFFCYLCIGRILGYAYETVPGKPIVAGDEGNTTDASVEPTLGALALGAPALDLWRREHGQE